MSNHGSDLFLQPGGDTLNYAKDVAIAIGGVTMAITFCGAYGAKKENKCMLGLVRRVF